MNKRTIYSECGKERTDAGRDGRTYRLGQKYQPPTGTGNVELFPSVKQNRQPFTVSAEFTYLLKNMIATHAHTHIFALGLANIEQAELVRALIPTEGD